MNFRGELALKFSMQIANRYTVPELIRLARVAQAEGFKQLWVNDNLGQRNVFVVLSALAARVPIKLGSSIVVPYFRNPVDIADSVAALSELTEGRELSIGIARGDLAHVAHQIDMQKPMAMVRETTLALKALLSGETIFFRDYPACSAYHRIRSECEFRLAFLPQAPVRFYCGGNGPKIIRIAGEIMDGTLIGNYYIPLLRSGRLDSLLAIARASAQAKQPGKALFDVCEIDISIARDTKRALQFAKPYVARIVMGLDRMGFAEEEFRSLPLDPRLVETLKEACAGGATFQAVSSLIPDHAVTSCFVAGDPQACRDQVAVLSAEAQRLGFGQMAFAKLGPDYGEAIQLLRHHVLPG